MKFRRNFCVQSLAKGWRSSQIAGHTGFRLRKLASLRQCFGVKPYARQIAGGVFGVVLLGVPAFVSAQVVISEIMYDTPGSDARSEWVEVQNIGAEQRDMTGWKFNDGSAHALNAPPKNGSTGSLVVEPGGFLILASDAAAFLSSHQAACSVIDTVMSLGNDKASLSLITASSSVEDKASYSSSKGAGGDGASLQKIDGKWKASAPTPCAANTFVAKAKPAKTAEKKTSTKKTVAKTKPQILDGTSTVAAEVAMAEAASSQELTAAAVVPVQESGSSFLPWMYSALAIGVAGAGAMAAARQKKKGEWDIEEIA